LVGKKSKGGNLVVSFHKKQEKMEKTGKINEEKSIVGEYWE